MKKRGKLALLLGLGPKEDSEGDDEEEMPEKPEEEEDDSGEDYEAMASEILDAIEQKDPKALAEALRGFVESCC